VLKARAFKTGFNPSPVATAEYFDPLEGDLYEQPILISGTNGVHTIADNSKFSREEPNEPYIAGYAYYRGQYPDNWLYPDYKAWDEFFTCWYRWKSPGTGEMTFKFFGTGYVYSDGSWQFGYLNSAIAFYEIDASSIDGLRTVLPVAANLNFNGKVFADVTVPVKAGKIYRIVGLQWYDPTPGTVTLSWEAEPGFVIPPPPLTVMLR
jgi:hypothetical protein